MTNFIIKLSVVSVSPSFEFAWINLHIFIPHKKKRKFFFIFSIAFYSSFFFLILLFLLLLLSYKVPITIFLTSSYQIFLYYYGMDINKSLSHRYLKTFLFFFSSCFCFFVFCWCSTVVPLFFLEKFKLVWFEAHSFATHFPFCFPFFFYFSSPYSVFFLFFIISVFDFLIF